MTRREFDAVLGALAFSCGLAPAVSAGATAASELAPMVAPAVHPGDAQEAIAGRASAASDEAMTSAPGAFAGGAPAASDEAMAADASGTAPGAARAARVAVQTEGCESPPCGPRTPSAEEDAIAAAAPSLGARAASPSEEEAADGARASAPDLLVGEVELRPTARFLFGGEAVDTDPGAHGWRVQQARLGARGRKGWVEAEVEADLAESSVLNEAWLRLTPARPLRVTLGRFKRPFSPLLLSSSWSHPLPSKGRLAEVAASCGVGGRALGLATELRSGAPWRASVALGIFEGRARPDGGVTEDLFVRAAVAPWRPVRLGASFARAAFATTDDGGGLGADVRIELVGGTLQLEWLRARADALGLSGHGVTGWAARRFALGASAWLEPALGAEAASAATAGASRGVLGAAGAGIGDHLLLRFGVALRWTEVERAPAIWTVRAGVQL